MGTVHVYEYLVTYVGLLHSLSLYLTPPPQVLLHELYGPNSLQPPFTGVTVLLPSMHCPRTQIYHHETIISMALYAYVSTYIGGSTACPISRWFISGCTRSSIGLTPQTWAYLLIETQCMVIYPNGMHNSLAAYFYGKIKWTKDCRTYCARHCSLALNSHLKIFWEIINFGLVFVIVISQAGVGYHCYYIRPSAKPEVEC